MGESLNRAPSPINGAPLCNYADKAGNPTTSTQWEKSLRALIASSQASSIGSSRQVSSSRKTDQKTDYWPVHTARARGPLQFTIGKTARRLVQLRTENRTENQTEKRIRNPIRKQTASQFTQLEPVGQLNRERAGQFNCEPASRPVQLRARQPACSVASPPAGLFSREPASRPVQSRARQPACSVASPPAGLFNRERAGQFNRKPAG